MSRLGIQQCDITSMRITKYKEVKVSIVIWRSGPATSEEVADRRWRRG